MTSKAYRAAYVGGPNNQPFPEFKSVLIRSKYSFESKELHEAAKHALLGVNEVSEVLSRSGIKVALWPADFGDTDPNQLSLLDTQNV